MGGYTGLARFTWVYCGRGPTHALENFFPVLVGGGRLQEKAEVRHAGLQAR